MCKVQEMDCIHSFPCQNKSSVLKWKLNYYKNYYKQIV